MAVVVGDAPPGVGQVDGCASVTLATAGAGGLDLPCWRDANEPAVLVVFSEGGPLKSAERLFCYGAQRLFIVGS